MFIRFFPLFFVRQLGGGLAAAEADPHGSPRIPPGSPPDPPRIPPHFEACESSQGAVKVKEELAPV